MQNARNAPSPHPIDRLWRLMTSDLVLALLLGLVALVWLAGLLLPQLTGSASQPEASSTVGASTSTGELWRSPGLCLLLGLLAFVLLLRLAQSAAEAAARVAAPDPLQAAAAAAAWPHHAAVTVEGDLADVVQELADDLRSEGWQVEVAQPGRVEAAIVAERSCWGVWAPAMLYAGGLLVLAGLWASQVFGWQKSGLVLIPGQPTALEHLRGSTLTVSEDIDEPKVTLQTVEGTSASATLSASGRARLGGIALRQVGEGQLVTLSARDAAGSPLQIRLLDEQAPGADRVALVFDQPRAERAVFIPTRQLVISVVDFPALPERGFANPTLLVQAFVEGARDPVFNEFVEGNASIAIGEDSFDLRRGQTITVQASTSPGTPLAVLGGLLALSSLLLGLWRPPGRLSLQLRQQRDAVHITAGLSPALGWRQGGRWLTAWAATYGGEQAGK